MEKAEQRKIDEVTAYLKRLPNTQNNTDLSTKNWSDALETRIEYVSELLETLKTGSTEHIIVSSPYQEPNPPKVEHFK